MKKIHIFILMTALLMLSLPVSAATVLYYDCDTDINGDPGVPGEPIQPGPGAATGIPDLSGNGYDLWGWCNAEGTDNNSPQFSDVTESGDGLSLYFDGGLDGYTSGYTALNAWSPETWTIEIAVRMTSTDGWQTFVGRHGSSLGVAESDFYFQKNDDGAAAVQGAFRANFGTVSAQRVILDSDFAPVADQWYYVAVVSDGATVTMYCDKLDGNGVQVVGSTILSGATPADNALAADPSGAIYWTIGRGWYNGSSADNITGYLDNIRFSDKALPSYQLFKFGIFAAHDGSVTPLNEDGSVGTLAGTQADDITLHFKAGADPNEVTAYPVNPAILEHYIYLSAGATDPNLYYLDSVSQTSLTDPNVSYLLPDLLDGGTVYYWMVEEGLNDGTDNAYGPGDPNNITGPIWKFTTIAATPTITINTPRDAVADASGNASFTVGASSSATSFEWYKVGDANPLTDGGIYSGTNTATLTITGAALADEGQFYCIAYNGLTPSLPSRNAYLWTHRLAGYWKFDGNMLDSVQDEVAGAPTHDGSISVSSTVAGPGDPNYVGDGNGIIGDAIAFFNDGDYVTIPDSDFFNFMPRGFTASFWYQAREPLVGWSLPMSKLDAGSAGWLFGTDHLYPAPQFTFIVEVPNNRMDGEATPDVGDGQWHMFAVTYDPDTTLLRLFTDGDEDAQLTVNLTTAPLPSALLSIGGRDTEASIDGVIDEVKLYTYAKTPTEVAEMYTGIRTDEYVCVIPDGSVLATYDLNGDCRITLADVAEMAREWLECQRIPADACDW